MLDLVLRVIRAILASLYMLFEGMPALEALRSWFGEGAGAATRGGFLTLIAGAALISLLAFLLFMWWISKRPPLPRRQNRSAPPKAVTGPTGPLQAIPKPEEDD